LRAGHRVVVSEAGAEASANFDEHLIADGRAHGVVEDFEGIKVYE
jgi:hypothetical protein